LAKEDIQQCVRKTITYTSEVDKINTFCCNRITRTHARAHTHTHIIYIGATV